MPSDISGAEQPTTRRPKTTQQFVLDELRRAIERREIAPGEAIRQDALAERLGVSRVPIREALKILEGEGQVLYQPHRGYQVVELSIDDLIEVYHLRRILETEAIRLGVPSLGKADLDELDELRIDIDVAGEVGDVLAMTAANRRFHFLIFDLAEMPRLSRLIRNLWDATDAYRSLYYAGETNRVHIRQEHEQILQAARAKDAERIVQLHDDHRDNAIRTLTAVIEAEASSHE